MSDESVRKALRSDAPLVVVEAPAGCGKTHQGSEYAAEIAVAERSRRILILTHTHAACSMFADRTGNAGHNLEIRTIDSVIAKIASAYQHGLELPADVSGWVRQRGKTGHAQLAAKVAALLARHPIITASLARRYPVVICDEHQDSSGDQHSLVTDLLNHGARVRIFADPMQDIFRDGAVTGFAPTWQWDTLAKSAHAFEELETPHRWKSGCIELGKWTLKARAALKNGGRIDLRSGRPVSLEIVFAENEARRHLDYKLSSLDRRRVDAFEKAQSSLLVLTHFNETARSLRGFFNRRILLWEGHTRFALETLVSSIGGAGGNRGLVASAVVVFMNEIGKGFSPSAFGDQFRQETEEGCTRNRRGKSATIQELARFVVEEPDHRGVAKMLRRLSTLRDTDANFASVQTDCHHEFWDAVTLGRYDCADTGLAEISHHRTHARPKPPQKAISTIHKAKGLECGSVIVMPCDAKSFPDSWEGRCLLYVALSRAKSRLLLVVPKSSPSPLLVV